jgi:hypothetical protein
LRTQRAAGFRKAPATGVEIDSSRAIVLFIEPAATASGAEPAAPVVFPGYVLPDDSLEDRSHEGS